MNPIMKGLNQPAQPQQGIASLAPTQPIQDHMDRSHIGNGIYDMDYSNQLTNIPRGRDETGPPEPRPYMPPGLEPPTHGIIDPNFSPYQRNENLDLTNRAGIMGEYSKYIQGGMGSRFSTMDVRGGYSFMGEDMASGSSTGFGDFRKFLDTYGIGDRLQMNPGSLGTAQPLQQTGSGLQGLAAYQSQQNTGPGI